MKRLASILAALAALALAAAPASAQVVRAFASRFSTNTTGDMQFIGNTLMTCSGGGCGNAQGGTGGNLNNNDFTMVYVDVDADASTFCSSTATLNLPVGATVLWAGLYWGGNSNVAARNQARFATPVAAYTTLTATQVDVSGTAYQGFIDVTARVVAGGNGTYTVANVRSTNNTANMFAGWSLVVVYRDPGAPPRNLVVFDGYAEVAPGATVNLTVNGFMTPPAGPVNTRLGVVVYEGDLGFTGDAFALNGTTLSNAVNPANNFFNSSITRFGASVTTKNPNYLNQLSFDIDQLIVTNLIGNSATSATIRLSSTDDRFYPGAVGFGTDLYAPVIGNGSYTKSVLDVNGGSVRPGDVLEYTLRMRNTGQDGATTVVARDTLPANATYVAGSLAIGVGANAGAKTDAADGDQVEYVGASRSVVARLGTGANGATGGSMAVNDSTSVRFRVTVNVPAANGSTVSNQGAINYVGAQTGTPFASMSDGNVGVAGDQPTVVTVVAPVISGTVFEDANYGGGAGRTRAASAGAAVPGARVELYDATGAFRNAQVTDAAGLYRFDGWTPGTYTVRAVNSTVLSTRPGALATLIGVQTFRTDATTGTAVAVADRVGGEVPSKLDAAANLTSATLASLTTATLAPQSITPVTLAAADVANADFGYNFDTIVNVNDTGQGSLRQFVTNANALANAGLVQSGLPAGGETSIFMVSDGAAHPGLRAGLANLLVTGLARVTLASALPAFTDAATRLDGATQTANVGNTNAGTLGAGGTVGVDALALGTVQRPEVELRDGAALAIGLDLQGASVTIASLALYGFGNAPASNADADLRIGAAASGATISACVIGAGAASFADPGAGVRSGGDHVRAVGGDNGIVTGSLIGFATGSGVALTGASDGWQVTGCELRGNAIGQGARDGIAIEASGTATVTANLVTTHEGAGVDAATSTGAVTLVNNTVTLSGRGTGAGVETPGVRLGGNGNLLDRNVLVNNYGAGVMVLSTAATNRFTRNSMSGNGAITNASGGAASGQIGIDLLRAADNAATGTTPFYTVNDNGDPDAGANGLLNFPVIESAVLANGSFTVSGWARPGSAIELFLAAADPSGFGEGQTYLATVTEGSGADLDPATGSYSGVMNGVNQGTDNTNRFRFTIAAPGGLVVGANVTATGTVAAATSEFSGIVAVVTGVTVSGAGYDDANHSLNRDTGENGTGVALWAKLVPDLATAAKQVAAIDPSTGAYAFTFVSSGPYSIVLDDNNNPNEIVATYPANWIGTEAGAGTRPLTVISVDIAGQDFGLWHGSRVDGVVFRDNGAGGGTANDGVRQGAEAGLAGVRVRLASSLCAGGACDSTLSAGGGAWTLWIPFAALGAMEVRESNTSGTLSTGGRAGTTGGAYSRPADAVTFAAAGGLAYSGVQFGDVPANAFAPGGTRSVAPGGAAFYPHTFTAGSAGNVSFSAAQLPTPVIPGWSVELYRDLNCNGVLDPAEPLIAAPLGVTAGQNVCLIAKHAAPAGAGAGNREQLTLSASFAYVGAAPALNALVSLADLTTVIASGGLAISKSVDLANARPGDVLTYTISYTNLGNAPLTSIVIDDATPPWTVFVSGNCVGLGTGLTGCALTTAPAVNATGPVRWTLSGALAPGGTGSVSYRVRVQ